MLALVQRLSSIVQEQLKLAHVREAQNPAKACYVETHNSTKGDSDPCSHLAGETFLSFQIDRCR